MAAKTKPANESIDAALQNAAIGVVRFRAALDWMLTHPDWEDGVAKAMAELGLKGQRQGVGHRKAVMSLPLESKHEMLRMALRHDLPRPTRQAAAKLARLWGDAHAAASSSSERITKRTWTALTQRLILRMSARYDAYKSSQLALFNAYAKRAERAADAICRHLSRRDDARQEARIALLQAIDRIEPSRAFAPYAKQWVQRAVTNFIMRERLPVKAPINLLSQAFSARNDTELDRLTATLRHSLREGVLSLDPENFESQAALLRHSAVEDSTLQAPEAVERADQQIHLAAALAELTPKQRDVLELRYGLGEQLGERSLAEVAQIVGISRQQVSQREQRGLARLAESLAPLRADFATPA